MIRLFPKPRLHPMCPMQAHFLAYRHEAERARLARIEQRRGQST